MKSILLVPRDKSLAYDEYLYGTVKLGFFDGLSFFRHLSKISSMLKFSFIPSPSCDVIWFLELPTAEMFYRYKSKYTNARFVVSIMESPAIVPVDWTFAEENFDLVFSWKRTIRASNHFYLPYIKALKSKKITPWQDRNKNFCMVASNNYSFARDELYGFRRKIIKFFDNADHDDTFHLYGLGWNSFHFFGLPYTNRLKRSLQIGNRRNYYGVVPNKFKCLSDFRFNFAIENFLGKDGYISEKIYDSIQAGSIPIYLGDEFISDVVPRECFVDFRDFSSIKDCIEWCLSLNEREGKRLVDCGQEFLSNMDGSLYSVVSSVLEVLNNEL